MLTRIITAAVVLGLFLPAIGWLPAPGWTLLCGLLTAWAGWEWARLSRRGTAMSALFAAVIAALSLALLQIPQASLGAYVVAGLFWALLAPLLLRVASAQPPGPSAMLRLLAGLLLLPPVFLSLVEIRSISPGLLLTTMGIVWISDSMAYFTGRAWGRHKLAPGISPGKTWEGVAGGLIAVGAYAAAMHGLVPGGMRSLPATVLLFLALAAAGIVGDLIESLLKRWAGVKDSGKMLPGHGGILDRVDALLPVLPLAALAYLQY